jgi:hypothetical protein
MGDKLADLRGRLTEDHLALLAVVGEAFGLSYEDPTPDWVLWSLRRGARPNVDALWLRQTLSTFPTISTPHTSATLGLVSHDPHLQGGSRIALSVLGVAMSGPKRSALVDRVLDALRHIGKQARSLEPPIAEPLKFDVTQTDLRELFKAGRIAEPDNTVRNVVRLLNREPIGRRGSSHNADFTQFTLQFGTDIADFAEVDSIQRYVDVLCSRSPYRPPIDRELPLGPLDLHSAIDHFNAVWRLSAPKLGFESKPLFKLPGAETMARLVFDCNTAEELESRLSGLKQILDVELPKGVGGRGPHVVRIAQHLQQTDYLDEVAKTRISEAMAAIAAIGAVRNAVQHSDALPGAIEAAHRLGLSLPIVTQVQPGSRYADKLSPICG